MFRSTKIPHPAGITRQGGIIRRGGIIRHGGIIRDAGLYRPGVGSGLNLGPQEFDVDGATYYAIAPAGHTYTAEQDTQYGARKYNSLASAIAGIDNSALAQTVLNILGDWSGLSDTGLVTLPSAAVSTPAASKQIIIRGIGEARANGVWDATGPRYRLTGTTDVFRVEYPFTHVDGIQVVKTGSNFSDQSHIWLRMSQFATDGVMNVSNTVFKGYNLPIAWQNFIRTGQFSHTGSFHIWNCVGHQHGAATSGNMRALSHSHGSCYVYNSSFYIERGDGLRKLDSGSLVCKNTYCAVVNAVGSTMDGTLTTCATANAQGSVGLQNIAPTNAVFRDVSEATPDFGLATGSPLAGAGTDISGEPAPLGFTTNIVGEERLTWHVGAF